ncbi:MAG: DUF2993 domain-containing protein [Elainellaceae cyanobacterium]
MEAFTTLLSALIALFSPVGTLTDVVLEDAIQAQIHSADVLEVRMDNRPSYDLLSGRVDRIRIAGRGIYPIPELRVALLDIETDPIDVRVSQLLSGDVRLQRPLQGVARLVITADDINRALRSPAMTAVLEDISIDALGSAIGQTQQANLIAPRIALLEGNRIRLQGILQEQGTDDELAITAELGVSVGNGHQLSIEDPKLVTDGIEFPAEILELVVGGLNQQLTLQALEPEGITARLLELDISAEALEAIAFIRVDPSVFP